MMKSLLESTLNTRDLGGYECTGGKTRSGSLIRSDRICAPTEKDIAFLRSNNITTIVDLRTDEDFDSAPCALVKEHGFTCCHIPIEEGGYVPERYEDVVPCYLNIAKTENMSSVFKAIANAPEGVLFNCWAGKDRTGVTAAVILLLCGVSEEDIINDYLLTLPYSEKLWEEIRKYRNEQQMRIVLPDRAFIKGFLDLFLLQFGSAESYLRKMSLSDKEIMRLKAKLCP